MTNNVSAWSQDGLTATERFRHVVRAMRHQRWDHVHTLYHSAPLLAWNGPDPAFQERVRTAETCTRAVVQDLNLVTVKMGMLTEFEKILQEVNGQQGCRIPETFSTSMGDLQTMLASYWQGWSEFVRTTWRLAPEEPIKAWFPNGSDELFSQIRRNPAKPDIFQAKAYQQPFEATWSNMLDAISQTGMGG